MSTEREREIQIGSLLEVAKYFGNPQEFLSVGEARSHFRDAVDTAEERSVVLTSHGEPQAALISYHRFETVRQAVIGLLVDALDMSWEATRDRARKRTAEALPTTEEEVEDMVADSIGRARSRRAKAVRSKGSRP